MLFDYNNSTKYIDTILNFFSNKSIIKGYLLSLFHYLFVSIVTLNIIFGDISYYWLISFILLYIILMCNIYHNGCIFMKMERKYFDDKEWHGPYNILIKMNILKKEQILPLFYCAIAGTMLIVLVRLFNIGRVYIFRN
jgi:hypothetical protein